MNIKLSEAIQQMATDLSDYGSVLVVCPTEELLTYTALGLQSKMGGGWEIKSEGKVRKLFKAGQDYNFLFVAYNDFAPNMLVTLVFSHAVLATEDSVEPYMTVNVSIN